MKHTRKRWGLYKFYNLNHYDTSNVGLGMRIVNGDDAVMIWSNTWGVNEELKQYDFRVQWYNL